MISRIWVLGADDPEMSAIETLLTQCGEECVHAITRAGRVSPANAYSEEARCATGALLGQSDLPDRAARWQVYCIECECPIVHGAPVSAICIDHHRPGDVGFGRPPAEFYCGSSLGQVLAELARLGMLPREWRRPSDQHGAGTPGTWRLTGYHGQWVVAEPWIYHGEPCEGHYQGVLVPTELMLVAAADHCLGAAYARECPGIDPDELLRFRVSVRAAFQHRAEADVFADIDAARAVLLSAPVAQLRVPAMLGDEGVCDLRGQHVPELPEAACSEGVAYLASVEDRDGRRKIVLGGATTPEQVRCFVDQWAPAQGLTGIYGDPARGFAGGYAP